MNTVNLLGRMTRDVELKQTANGGSVGRFGIAVDRNFKNAQGEREADFINCVAFNKTAELINQYFRKGSKIALDGRIQTGSYENQQGQKVYTTDIIVNNFYFVDSANKNGQANQQSQQYNNPFGDSARKVDVDLPF